MNQYVGDLMMGVLIASTAFCGLTGVVMGQIKGSTWEAWEKKQALWFLFGSFILGVFAVILTIIWFSSPTTDISLFSVNTLSPFLLIVQVVFFVAVVSIFWLSEN